MINGHSPTNISKYCFPTLCLENNSIGPLIIRIYKHHNKIEKGLTALSKPSAFIKVFCPSITDYDILIFSISSKTLISNSLLIFFP